MTKHSTSAITAAATAKANNTATDGAAHANHDSFPRGFWPIWPKMQWLIKRRREFLQRHRKALIWGQLGFVIVAILIMIVGMHVFAPDLRKFTQRSPVLFDAKGNVLYSAMTQDDYHRIYTTVDDVDPLYIKMLLAAEDERFYHHWGVDSFAIIRALMQNVQNKQIVSGASTITMQVCRLLEPKKRDIFNKVKEALGALHLTYYQGREAVLNMYLTLAPFGGNIEGVTAASYMYFGHSPKHLTPDEAALLVALPRAPEGMRPDRHPKIARYYRHQVLAKAYEDKIIAKDIMELADKEPLPRQRLPLPQPAYHLGQSLFLGKLQTPERAQIYPVSSVALIEQKNPNNTVTDNITHNFSLNKSTVSGDKVASNSDAAHTIARFVLERQQPTELYSTIDPHIQQILNQIAQEYIESLPLSQQKLRQESIALIAVDNRNFTVLGYVGSPYIKLSYVDAVQALRSPGSALKPFAYAMAFAQNLLHPHSLLLDTAHFYGSYQPHNYDRRFFGEINAAQALQASLNLPAIEIMKAIGPDRFINNLNQFTNAQDLSDHSDELDSYTHGRLHLAANTQPHLGLVLGAGEISLYDLTQLYAALAHDGKITPLTLLRRPQDHSRALEIVNRTLIQAKGSNKYFSSSIDAKNSKATSNAVDNDFSDSDVPSITLTPSSQKVMAPKQTQLTNITANVTAPTSSIDFSAKDINFGPFLPEDAARATYLILNDTPAPAGYQQHQMQISYKTGTSYKYRDTVALGSSGGLTIGIWTGRLDGKPRRAYSAFESVAPILFKTFASLPSVPRILTPLPPSPLLSATPPVALARVSTTNLGKVQRRVANPSHHTIPVLGQLNANNTKHAQNMDITQAAPDTSRDINNSEHSHTTTPDSYDYIGPSNEADFNPVSMPAINNPLQLHFPQNDTRLQVGMSGQIFINFSGGQAPYYVLVNDKLQNHSDYFYPQYNGIHLITVIDSLGNSVSSQVYIQGVNDPQNINNEIFETPPAPNSNATASAPLP